MTGLKFDLFGTFCIYDIKADVFGFVEGYWKDEKQSIKYFQWNI